MRLLLLHGFTATGRSWDPVRRHLDAQRYPDVATPDLRERSLPAQVDALRQAEPYELGGYSMGGRVALLLALAQPELVTRLTLVSTTAGIDDPQERARRRAADDRLAAELEREAGVEAFADRWAAQPLFTGQPRHVAEAAREDRLTHTAHDLAATLRGLGTGVMAPVWDRLRELTMPATVVVGERDAKFRALGERLAEALPQSKLAVVPGAGHAVHLEAPEAVVSHLTSDI